jgi:5'-nucleotidase
VEEAQIGLGGRIKAWTTNGTPSDCVKIGLMAVLEEKPDIIIAGINNGPNLGADVLYSGTVSAAMEGAVLGYPSIAISSCGVELDSDNFSYAADFLSRFLDRIASISFPKKTILNINVPAIEPSEITGIRITRLGTRMYTDKYEKRVDPRGKTYYWLAGELIDTCEEEGSDIIAIKDNKISITPITFEMTHKSIMPELEKAFCNGLCEP